MVRRPHTDTAIPPILVNTEHGYVAPIPGFPVGALLTDNTADGDAGAIIRISLRSERSENIHAEVRYENDMRYPEHSSLGRRDAACAGRSESSGWRRRDERRAPLVQEVPIGVNDVGL